MIKVSRVRQYTWTACEEREDKMVHVCSFPGCDTRMRKSNPETFHRLPLRESNLKQWLVVLQFDVGTPIPTLKAKDYRVCSRHFDLDDFTIPDKRTSYPPKRLRLKRNAIPKAARLAPEICIQLFGYITWTEWILPYFSHYKAHRIRRRTFNEWPILELFSYIRRTGL